MEINGVKNAGVEDSMQVLEKILEETGVPFKSQLIPAAHPLKQYKPNYPTLIFQYTREDV